MGLQQISLLKGDIITKDNNNHKHHYYVKHKKQVYDGIRNWQLRHPEIIKIYSKRYYLKHKSTRKYKEKVMRSARNYAIAHPERIKEQKKKYDTNLKLEVLSRYSQPDLKCAKCGFSDIRALSIDHINGGGLKHKREIAMNGRGGGHTFYEWLRKNNYPIGFQVLCMNCQFIKRVENNELGGRPIK